MNISTTTINEIVYATDAGRCLRRIQYRYVDKAPFTRTEPSDVVKLGYLFEYYATGVEPSDWPVQEFRTQPTKNQPDGKKTAAQERVEAQAALFAGLCEHYEIEVERVGVRLEYEELAFKAVAVVDIVGKVKGRRAIIDLKYTGGLYEKTDYGWHVDKLPADDRKMRQAKIYKLIGQKALGEEVDFYFFVFSSAEVGDHELIKVEISPDTLKAQEQEMYETCTAIEGAITLSGELEPRPSFKECSNCEFREVCPHAITTKTMQVIQL